MESPLDILSRAAGMVSRSHDISPPSSAHRGLRESSCHILKLTLDNATSRQCEEEEEEQERPDVEDSPSVPATEHNLYEDDDTPLDMSIKKVKRKVSASVTEEDEEDKPRDQLMKRKRPSVISFASQPPLAAADMDVDDHFKKSLGIEFYNTVFSSRDGDQQRSSPSEGGPSSSDSFEGVRKSEVRDEPVKKPNSPSDSSTEPDTRPASAELENTVDDHFVKALGRSTWMKLRQGL